MNIEHSPMLVCPRPGLRATALEVDQWWETQVRLQAASRTSEQSAPAPPPKAEQTAPPPESAELTPAPTAVPMPSGHSSSTASGSVFLRAMLSDVGEPKPVLVVSEPELDDDAPPADPVTDPITEKVAGAPEIITAGPVPVDAFVEEAAAIGVAAEPVALDSGAFVHPETITVEPEPEPECTVDPTADIVEPELEQTDAVLDLREGRRPIRRLRNGNAKSPESLASPRRSLRELWACYPPGAGGELDEWMGVPARPLRELVRAGVPSPRPVSAVAAVPPSRRAGRSRTVVTLVAMAAICLAGGPVVGRALTSPAAALPSDLVTAPGPTCVNRATGQVTWSLPSGHEVVTVIRPRQREQDLISWPTAGSTQRLTIATTALSTLKEC